MKGIIEQAIQKGLEKGKSLYVVKRYLRIKHKIKTTIKVLKNRIKSMPTIPRGKEWDID